MQIQIQVVEEVVLVLEQIHLEKFSLVDFQFLLRVVEMVVPVLSWLFTNKY